MTDRDRYRRIRAQASVAGGIDERVVPFIAAVGHIRERAVGVERDRAVGWTANHRRREGIAVGVAVVRQNAGRIYGEHGTAIDGIAVVNAQWRLAHMRNRNRTGRLASNVPARLS